MYLRIIMKDAIIIIIISALLVLHSSTVMSEEESCHEINDLVNYENCRWNVPDLEVSCFSNLTFSYVKLRDGRDTDVRHILVTTKFKTSVPKMQDLQQRPDSDPLISCLRLMDLKVEGSLVNTDRSVPFQKWDFHEYQDRLIEKISGQNYSVKDFYRAYLNIVKFEFRFTFPRWNGAAGFFVSYDAECVRSINNSKIHPPLNVSSCAREIKAPELISADVKNRTFLTRYLYRILKSDYYNLEMYPNFNATWNILNFTDLSRIADTNATLKAYAIELADADQDRFTHFGYTYPYSGFHFEKIGFPVLAAFGIEELSLARNRIGMIGRGDFSETIPTLKALHLNDVGLEFIEYGVFMFFPKLEYLNLAHNRLKRLDFAYLYNLRTLNLSFNANELVLNFTDKVPNPDTLTHLDMSFSRAQVAPLFVDTLEILNLSHTELTLWTYNDPPLDFVPADLPNLKHLIADGNPKLTHKIFRYNFPSLYFLDLTGNILNTTFDFNQLFVKFPSLRNLKLERNGIEQLWDLQLPSNRSSPPQFFLSLRNNDIKSWNERKLKEAIPVTLDLSRNAISTVNEAMLSDFSLLRKVILDPNPFDCSSDCDLLQFQQWVKQGRNTSFLSYKCELPDRLKNQLAVEVDINLALCVFDWLRLVLLPIVTFVIITSAIVALVFKYKWHLRYLRHLIRARMMAKRRKVKAGEETAPQHLFDAFVSYCSADSDWVVGQLVPHLEREEPPTHLCIHDRDFLAGGVISDNIIECIDISRKSIFLISKGFLRSHWCQWELQMAQHKLFEDGNDVLILVLLEELEGVDVPKILRRLMTTRTYLVWPSDLSNVPAAKLFWARLKRAIGQCYCEQAL